ncbi:MAG: ATP synthase subunit I [Formosimonas sp.]
MGFAIGLQAIFAALAVLVAMLFGQEAMWSAFAGSVVAIAPNVIFALYLKTMKKMSVVRFFVGEAAKVAMMIGFSLWVWQSQWIKVDVVAYWAALIVVIKAHNLSLLRTIR